MMKTVLSAWSIAGNAADGRSTLSRVCNIVVVFQLLCRFDVQQEDAIPARHDALQNLEEVEISGFHGTPKQIEFVVLLLRCAKLLRTLIIYLTLLCLNYLLYDKPFSLSDEETRAS